MEYWNPGIELTSMDTSGLMGAKITFVDGEDTTYHATVAGVDPYIGISLVRSDNPKRIALCLRGPFDPTRREAYLRNEGHNRDKYMVRYPTFLKYLREVVEGNGRFIADVFYEELDNLSENSELDYGPGGYGGGTCPYGV